jgi:hypothetical protein
MIVINYQNMNYGPRCLHLCVTKQAFKFFTATFQKATTHNSFSKNTTQPNQTQSRTSKLSCTFREKVQITLLK